MATLYIRRGAATEQVVDIANKGITCLSAPFLTAADAKPLPSRNWPDEHGDDIYFPAKMMLAAYDEELTLGCMTTESAESLAAARTAIFNFIDWLTGNDTENGGGTELAIYSPYTTQGRQHCHFAGIAEEDAVLMRVRRGGSETWESYVTFKVKIHVGDPYTNITLAPAND